MITKSPYKDDAPIEEALIPEGKAAAYVLNLDVKEFSDMGIIQYDIVKGAMVRL